MLVFGAVPRGCLPHNSRDDYREVEEVAQAAMQEDDETRLNVAS